MKITKIYDWYLNSSLEMYENDDNKIFVELYQDSDIPSCITLDKEDAEEIVKTLNDFING